ncbi:low-specificity L-threonine aldolase [Salisediminibacterium selenitireducens]|uniref:Threonine aldolase n=1 Tax=Bacillus selenitireducens (strain ATCC 700615 / DSM 15326 / MLS10) TaxID=439292 RepID=D6XYX3_BACIE|nr:low-specificity L-threonine aldolase [Salisediminibacterium selenitireducens]ADH98281.1 Threonine aldolase [[Bacillus] selenitireducens MLS10]
MIDLRSDTVTRPTAAMRQAAFEAEVGDDVYGEDPNVNALEEEAAAVLGKEAALFVTSGTQGNQLAALVHARPGQEVILEQDAHIYLYEGGAISALAGVQPRTIAGKRGAMAAEDVDMAIRAEDIHFPETGLIFVENTHNKAGGAVVSVADMKAVFDVAQANGIPVHLDGARLFNAAVSAGVTVADFAKYTDSVQVCLSKGLGAPVGSIIAGSEAFISQARKWRKRLGGGMRQAGVIAAPARIALKEHVDRLEDDHRLARELAKAIGQYEGLSVLNHVETNIVMMDVRNSGLTHQDWIRGLKERGVLTGGMGPGILRFVTHLDVSEEDIRKAVLPAIGDLLSR